MLLMSIRNMMDENIYVTNELSYELTGNYQ